MKLKFNYKENQIEFSIIRKKRKTISIKIEEDGSIIVSAPLRISKEYILLAVREKAYWIIKKQNQLKESCYKKIKREFINGSSFMYLGKEYSLNLILDETIKEISVDLKETFNIYTNTTNEEKLRFALEKWYRYETLKIVTERIDYYSHNFKDKVTQIKVKEQKRRWASCTGKNAILFNWRISMARADVIDYVVIHEMCHMDHRDHSKHFWNRVEEIMPDYKKKHNWLKENGINLYL